MTESFTKKLLASCIEHEKNGAVSPISIQIASFILAAGAREDTCSKIIDYVCAKPQGVCYIEDVDVNNIVLFEPEYKLERSFVKDVAKYDVSFEKMDTDPDAVVRRINAYVAEKTHNKILAALNDGDICANTRLVIVNTVYLKQNWLSPFDGTTAPRMFHVNHRSNSPCFEVPTMKMRDAFEPYYENEKISCISLPFKNRLLYMIIILPKYDVDLEEANVNFNLEDFNATKKRKRMDIFLPKFSLECSTDLRAHMSANGLAQLFSTGSGLDNFFAHPKGVFVDDVIHRTIIEVDENGVEAAAVTGMLCTDGISMPCPSFKVNRPFMFMIVDNNQIVYFTGVVYDPTRK